jgi:hypothetical protein
MLLSARNPAICEGRESATFGVEMTASSEIDADGRRCCGVRDYFDPIFNSTRVFAIGVSVRPEVADAT